MSVSSKERINKLVLELLAEDPDDAAAASLVRLCRESPKVKTWLWYYFAASPKTREQFARLLEQSVRVDISTLARAAGKDRGCESVNAALRLKYFTASPPRPYGGLSRLEVDECIERYQAGSQYAAAFQLVRAWRATSGEAPASAALVTASAAFLAEALGRGNRGLLHQLVRADAFHRARDKIGIAAYGHQHRWKVSVLLYLLNNPKPKYRTSELSSHLATRKMTVSGKLIRRFCARHGIARDSRPGRPRLRDQ